MQKKLDLTSTPLSDLKLNVTTLIRTLSQDETYSQILANLTTKVDYRDAAVEVGWQVFQFQDKFALVNFLTSQIFFKLEMAVLDVAELNPDSTNTLLSITDCFYFDSFNEADALDNWQRICYEQNIYPIYRAVSEYWVVSYALAQQLLAEGEPVLYDFLGLTIWGRCSTEQAASTDPVIQKIAATM